MAETIVDGTLFNAADIRYSAPKANASGGKSINILNKLTNSGLRISTPLMLTWGASDFVDEKTGKGNGKFEMSLQFPNDEYKTEDTAAFLTNMQQLEAKIKDDALTNSKEWFGKVHKNAEVVDALYTPMLKYSRNRETGEPDLNKAPTLRVKIPMWDGSWRCEVYDEDGEKLFPNLTNPLATPIDLIQKGTQVASLIQCGGIWFANGKFGVTWKLIQVVVQKPRASLSGQCFIKLKTADKEKLKSTPAPVADVVDDDNEAVHTAEVEDSDEEEDDTPVPTPAPAPAPAPVAVPPPAPAVAAVAEEPKKKKVVKKKIVQEAT